MVCPRLGQARHPLPSPTPDPLPQAGPGNARHSTSMLWSPPAMPMPTPPRCGLSGGTAGQTSTQCTTFSASPNATRCSNSTARRRRPRRAPPPPRHRRLGATRATDRSRTLGATPAQQRGPLTDSGASTRPPTQQHTAPNCRSQRCTFGVTRTLSTLLQPRPRGTSASRSITRTTGKLSATRARALGTRFTRIVTSVTRPSDGRTTELSRC